MDTAPPYKELLNRWISEASLLRRLHERAALRNYKANLTLNIVIIAVSSFLGSAVLSGVNAPSIAIVGLLIAVASALINFLRLQEIAEKHRAAAVKYSHIFRHASFIATEMEAMGQPNVQKFEALLELWKSAHEEAPYVTRPPEISAKSAT